MITEIIESKIFTTHMPCEFKCELDGKAVIQNNGGRMININVNIKKSYMWKRSCLESCYIYLWKWRILWIIQRLCVMKL